MENDNHEIDDDKLNEIRKRTFNSELKNLVDKVSNNEELSDTSNKNNKDPKYNELLKRIHKLFYSIVNIENNHIEIDGTNEMKFKGQVPFENFHIFKYNEACQYFDIHYSYLPIDNVLLSPNEILYYNIANSTDGLFLDSDSFDEEYKIKFLPMIGDNKCCFIDQLTFQKKILNLNGIILSETLKSLTPVICIIYNKEKDINDIIDYLMFDSNFISYVSKLSKEKIYINSINDIAASLEKNIYISKINHLHKSLLVYKGRYDNEIFTALRHIFSKLKKIISNESKIVFIEKEKILMLLSAKDIPVISRYVADINNIYYNQFQYYNLDNINERNFYYYIMKMSLDCCKYN